MTEKDKIITEILIASITPYFLDKGALWYTQNYKKIKQAAQNQLWWKDNVLFLDTDSQVNLFALLRQVSEMGYQKVQTLGAPGEFSHRGGILDIFPINCPHAWRLEFSGQQIFSFEFLSVNILKTEKSIKKDLANRQTQSLLSSIKPGEFLVHLDHGIGNFIGFANQPGGQISLANPTEKSDDRFFVVEYAKKDRLYVPLALEEKLSRYIGFERPIIHRLGGSLWLKTRKQAKEDALTLAKELLDLYGQRAGARGFQYPAESQWQKELADDFPYVETDDQARAIDDVTRDMESSKPMDRLICGDVGFGKTEVALRAAFKSAEAGRQVAVLCPTTILANQHWHNFSSRLKKFPVKIALLTRLQSKNQQKKIVKEIEEGKTDIVIGTHRLLSKDIQFKNLGLAIIDEEQRFGVKQKEVFNGLRIGSSLPCKGEGEGGVDEQNLVTPSFLKEGRPELSSALGGFKSPLTPPYKGRNENNAIDILSLSATPIPRTLHLTLAGLRDVSIINTPPPGRLPIKTFVQANNKKIIKEAIAKELARHGQVYYLHNRVQTIGLAAREIKKLAPSADIAFIHGHLPEKELIKIMDDFETKKIHVLVATTIIENGLDFPNVNTLIVANAVRLGLAQAYQLRGRIGRSNQQAYAYFLYNSKNLTDDSAARLKALQENETLGSGYQIALRDLEIRGAGNVLGREQSGPVNSVGLNLYMQMLNESIEDMKNDFNPFVQTDELG